MVVKICGVQDEQGKDGVDDTLWVVNGWGHEVMVLLPAVRRRRHNLYLRSYHKRHAVGLKRDGQTWLNSVIMAPLLIMHTLHCDAAP